MDVPLRPDEHETLFTRLTLLPSMYGVVERIRGMLSSDVFHYIKSQPTSLLTESDLQALDKTLSDLHASFPHIHHKFLTIEGSQRFNDVEKDIRRLRRDVYGVKDVLDVAATKHLKENHPDLPESEQMLLADLRCKLRNMRRILEVILDDLETYASGSGIAVADKMSTSPGFMLHSTEGIGASPLELEDFIVGRDSDKEDIIDSIFSPSIQEHPNIISVYGEAGIGKTTLVKTVCNDVRVSTSFDLVLCIPPSWERDFSSHIERTIVEIIRSVTHQSEFYQQEMDIESLNRRLRGILQGQKYLLILDDFDLSDHKNVRWLELMEIFKLGSTGSTVILINYSKPRGVRMEAIRLIDLPERESWLLFSRCAEFDDMEEQQYPSLKEIGRSMVTKCHGNPLAIKTLGSMLRTSRDEHTWKRIDRIFSSFSDPVSAALGISIENMPYDLMQCFLASAILFEHNVAVCKEQLLYFWMAHGILPSSEGNKDTRDLVDAYCNQLLLRGFLQVDRCDYHPTCGTFQMHKQVRDSAKLTIGEEYDQPYGSRWIKSIGRHLMWRSDGTLLPGQHGWMKTRTILVKHNIRSPIDPFILKGLISNLSLVRVLWLDHAELERLPNSIDTLKLLRYLSLEGTHRLQVLPYSICNLINLQTLDLSGCVQLKALPVLMHYLVSLRHMLLSVKLTSLPEEALKSWTSLHLLKICYCQHLNSLSEGIQQLTALQVLRIHACPSIASLPSSIKYLTNLKELSILDCQMLDLTGWEGLDGLTCLQFLQFQGLPNMIEFPEGLQSAGESLRHLVVSNCQYLKALPECLDECNNLLELLIDGCPTIVALPRGIHAVKTLKVLKIFNCPELIAKCELGKEDWHLISHIPKIHLRHPATKGHAAEHPCHARGGPQIFLSQYDINIQAGAPSSAIPSTSRDLEISDFNTQGALPDVEILDIQEPKIVMEDEYSMFDASSDNVSQDLHHSVISGSKLEPSPKEILLLLGKDYEFEKEMLIQLWMALGFLMDEPMEAIGANYFEKLVSEGYILCSVANSYKVNTEKLHTALDIVREKQNYVILGNGSQNDDAFTESLHVSVLCDEIDETVFKKLRRFSRLRTLLFLGNYGSRLQQVPRDLFMCYEFLVALDLSGTRIKELPSSTRKMINLRYLDLSWTFIELLPERIDRFRRLQTLKLKGCSHFCRLPKEMKTLTLLRHLDLDVLRQLTAFPKGIGALLNLQTLSAFPVGTEEGLKISELKYLNNLTGEFCIANLENVHSEDEAKEASLIAKWSIKKLELRWSRHHQSQGPRNKDEAILENLCPYSDLEEIQILCYHGTCLPSWISDVSLQKLVSISLMKCENVAILASLEKLPSLKSLELVGLSSVIEMNCGGEVDHVAFPNLQKLAIDGLLNLETWTEAQEGDYPSLVELSIKDCPKLPELPSLFCLLSLKHLEVSGCSNLAFLSEKELSTSLQQLIVEDCPLIEARCSNQKGQDWYKIQHVPTIWIDQVAIQQEYEDDKEAPSEEDESDW